MCDLYLGDTNSRSTTPPTPFYTNPSIQSSTYTFTEGTTYSLNVVLQNHDTAGGCNNALVTLYWSDPTTSFLLESANVIGNAAGAISFATSIPPADAALSLPFSWTPPAAAAGTNGGHVCLAAVASCTSTDCTTAPAPCGPGQTATVGSPQVAIHNVQVNPPPPGPNPPPGGGGGGPGGPGGGRAFPTFFFGATNGGKVAGITRLVARALNPDQAADRHRIAQLAALPSLQQVYGKHMKFATPTEVLLALGPESILARSIRGVPVSRLGVTGPVTHHDFAEQLVKRAWVRAPGDKAATKDVDLMPRQVQQAAVTVVPRHEDGRIYAIEVGHELVGHGGHPGELLGGLTIVFSSPHTHW